MQHPSTTYQMAEAMQRTYETFMPTTGGLSKKFFAL
jgi:hypothetical protein